MGTRATIAKNNAAALMALDYETHHCHAQNQMIFDFGKGNKIVVDRKTQKAYKIWRNEPKDSFSIKDMPIQEFESIIIAFGNQIPV
ncbi:hypothetical protein M2451_002582 [Dysgonomonas sp. PFB1-18]|uniref:hypothetical protein n=1 Tax=unclassified Dysgonomonas TaxID=2630389 RepID=UPI0024753881|nr:MULTISPECIES: hypothetical protein [unclassified Dysgonomonas]MDH6308063.1 hypothetical protein [Dysgonomonas sp. PF1-14]MDH6339602.1 hypothetical protein [Dysgonomonas sp. PF1-16]MDH6381253.1 hypothetical protein [Dysgonomonas sp. PFB1-18]MDH6398465.1 hypothetical protein [Dysgonomonas sp. PF1-23]